MRPRLRSPSSFVRFHDRVRGAVAIQLSVRHVAFPRGSINHVIVFLSMFGLLLLKVDVPGERDQSQAAFAGMLVAGHVLMILAGVCYASRNKVGDDEEEEEEQDASGRPRVGAEGVPLFETAPASWRSLLQQGSVSE